MCYIGSLYSKWRVQAKDNRDATEIFRSAGKVMDTYCNILWHCNCCKKVEESFGLAYHKIDLTKSCHWYPPDFS